MTASDHVSEPEGAVAPAPEPKKRLTLTRESVLALRVRTDLRAGAWAPRGPTHVLVPTTSLPPVLPVDGGRP